MLFSGISPQAHSEYHFEEKLIF